MTLSIPKTGLQIGCNFKDVNVLISPWKNLSFKILMALDKRDIQRLFVLVLHKKHTLRYSLEVPRPVKALLMCTHSICFSWRNKKIKYLYFLDGKKPYLELCVL